jgi:hypothetical protein
VAPGDAQSAFGQAAAEDGIVLGSTSFEWLCERTTLLNGDETCFQVLEAASHDAVAEACRLAGLETPRIVPAVE